MIKKIKGLFIGTENLKRVVAFFLTIIIACQTIIKFDTTVYGDNYSALGTNTALGSPVLSSSFDSTQWNKWESVVWGIFLSNFTVPLIDDYDSAFNQNATTGSKGAGLKALQFGSGSDPANNKTIVSLLDFAVKKQKEYFKPIYVKHTEIDIMAGETFANKSTSTDDSGTDITQSTEWKEATLKDFLIRAKSDDGNDTYVQVGDTKGSINSGSATVISKIDGYKNIITAKKANLPTFSIQSSVGHEVVFDFTDPWDLQMVSVWLGRTLASDHADEFAAKFSELIEKADTVKLGLDCYGNICIDDNGSHKILMPASANQHLSSSPKINMINSLVFNGYMQSANANEMNILGQQQTWDKLWGLNILPWGTKGDTSKKGKADNGGTPALSSKINGISAGTPLIYYDTDNIVVTDSKINSVKGLSISGNYGSVVKNLYDCDINSSTVSPYIPKIEISNITELSPKGLSDVANEVITQTYKTTSMLPNGLLKSPKTKVWSSITTSVGKESLFSDPIIIPVQMETGYDNSKITNAGIARLYNTFLYKVYKGQITNTTGGNVSASDVTSIISSSSTPSELKTNFLKTEDNKATKLVQAFVTNSGSQYFKADINKIKTEKITSADKFFADLPDSFGAQYNNSGDEDNIFARLIKAYPVSNTMINVSKVMGTKENTDFAVWSAYIYITYLENYGVLSNAVINKDNANDFNTKIFDENSDALKLDISTIEKSEATSKEDKEEDILNYTYLMLHPTAGREYRTQLLMDGLTDWIYETYTKMVYGNSTSYTSAGSNLATRNASGFLQLSNYSENFLTSKFMNNYVNIAVWLIVISFIIIVITGLLRSKKISWFLISMVVSVNAILIVPCTGELVPYMANRFVQKMFTNNMTYWAISEAVSNANIEQDLLNSSNSSQSFLTSLTQDETSRINSIVKSLNVVYLDRSLMVKNDISKKVTQSSSINYADLQQYKSTRWLLPMIMRQFSANDGSADYVYTPLGDLYDNMSNMYWYYEPNDAVSSKTVNGNQTTQSSNDENSTASISTGENTGASTISETEKTKFVSNIKARFSDYENMDTYIDEDWSSIACLNEDYESSSIGKKSDIDAPHSYFYMLNNDNASLVSRKNGLESSYDMSKFWSEYSDKSIDNLGSKYKTLSMDLEDEAQTYLSSDRSTIKQSYGFLWSTESPSHYFYQVVKDSIPSSDTIGTLAWQLQGKYDELSDGTEVRKSFMYSKDTGYLRDVADLETMFRNMLPYMYQMTITTGGTDGNNGVLGDDMISNYSLYADVNNKAWLFRSNWAIKLMENKSYSSSASIKDADGNKYRVANMLLPDCYPSERPMIFSEAQKESYNLRDSDLNLVELKCIETNKNIARKWTLLLNYINTDGMTKEVMERAMALNALLEFNSEFSPKNVGTALELMPSTVDLRAISFDSVMKMLMLNITKDTTYIYSDTMKNIIADSDIFTELLLLLAAFLSAYIIPLIRDLVLALIFYFGFASIIRTIVIRSDTKLRVTAGYLISNIVTLGMTLLYYGAFSCMMRLTTNETVLSSSAISVNTGNPVWCFIIVVGIDILYIIGLIRMLELCFKHFRDMGIEVYSSVAYMVTDGISKKLGKLGDKLLKFGSGGGNSRSADSLSGTGRQVKKEKVEVDNDNPIETLDVEKDGRSNSTQRIKRSKGNNSSTEYDSKPYEYGGKDDLHYYSDVSKVDKEIEKGKEIGSNDIS